MGATQIWNPPNVWVIFTNKYDLYNHLCATLLYISLTHHFILMNFSALGTSNSAVSSFNDRAARCPFMEASSDMYMGFALDSIFIMGLHPLQTTY